MPGKGHYQFEYLARGRMFSLAHQIDAAVAFKPETVLEVGVGAGVAAAALRALAIRVTTLDVQPELKPDMLASVLDVPAAEGAFDVSVCCQVLEHLPFEQFSTALSELRRVTKRGLVLSLPDVTPHIEIVLAAPWFKRRRWSMSFSWLPKRPRPEKLAGMGHHWEIGYRGYELPRVREMIEQSGWRIDRCWRVPEKQWHRFFTLTPA